MEASNKLLYGWTISDYNCQWSNVAECLQHNIKLSQHGCLIQAELVVLPSAKILLMLILGMWL
jgi:hypothetical protein